MAGIYIHIPFCKQACYYCDFHFSTNLNLKDNLLRAIATEIDLQSQYLENDPVSSIYFGGGTPSVLTAAEVENILHQISGLHQVTADAEITLEANPDDLTRTKVNELKSTGINRLSIGIQSFHDPHLSYMNRAHNAREATQCVSWASEAGIDNLSIDLIYGIPAKNHEIWNKDLEIALSLPISHISAYCLTIEPDTAFGRWVAQKKMQPADEEFAASQFEMLLARMEKVGFEQYEISSFCKKKQYSRHNSSYWLQQKYLGIGPSAHSFDGTSRQFNIANNQKYIQSIQQGEVPFTKEVLSPVQVANEYLLTSIRTIWGSSLEQLELAYPGWHAQFDTTISEFVDRNLLVIDDNVMKLTTSGKLIADEISLQLFMDE